MTKQLIISDNVTIDPMKLVDSRMLITANSGGGKSWLIRVIAEQAVGVVQTIILDHEGEFSTLREKFDFLLAGPGGEIPADVRSSSLLARKLLELQASAVVDMSAMKLQERRKFVRLFVESLMSAPKNLWHPLLLIIDETHIYCPERSAGEAESTQAVIDLMSMGRKRSFCGILATQRLSKLHKDAEAEANNIFTGRTWLDIDQKRACGLLGFGKEYYQHLRDMEAGKFFAFGPALSVQGVRELKVAKCVTTHPRPGHRHNFTPPKPSDAVRRIVSELADLPQQAEAEIRNLDEAKKQIAELTRQLRQKPAPVKEQVKVVDQEAVKRAVEGAWKEANKERTKERSTFVRELSKLGTSKLLDLPITLQRLSEMFSNATISAPPVVVPVKPFAPAQPSPVRQPVTPSSFNGDKSLPAGEKNILIAAMQFGEVAKEQITILTGFKKSTRNAYIKRLRTRGFIEESGGMIRATQEGIDAVGSDYTPLPTGSDLMDCWLKELPKGEAELLAILRDRYPGSVSRDELRDLTGQAKSTCNAYLQRMRTKMVYTEDNNGVRASDILF